jgi:hypothetical protein
MVQQKDILATANGDINQNGGPVYRLIKEEILEIDVDAIVVSTDLDMEVDCMKRLSSGRLSNRARRWINQTYPSGDPNIGVSLTHEYNQRVYVANAIGGLGLQTCLETPGGSQYLLTDRLLLVCNTDH